MDKGAESYRRYLEGDDSGIVEIIRDYKDGLILFLTRYVGSIHTAEELAEDTFFIIFAKKPKYSPKNLFKTWLYTIGRNTALNYIRRESRKVRQPIEELPELADEGFDLEQSYLREERKLAVHRALYGLRTDYASVLHLKYFDELSNEEIAAVMKKNRRQIENLLYRAKGALKEELERNGINGEDL